MGKAVTDNVETGTQGRGDGPPRTARPWPSPTTCSPCSEDGSQANDAMTAVVCSSQPVTLGVADHSGQGCNQTVSADAAAREQETDDIEEIQHVSVYSARDVLAAEERGAD